MTGRGAVGASARRRQKARNLVQGAVLIVAMAAVAGLLTWLLFGREAIPWVIAGMVLMGLLTPRVSSRWLLSRFGAQPLAPASAPGLYAIVDELATSAGLSRLPQVHYLPQRAPNAFTLGGRKDPALVVTEGLLRLLDRRQLTGVLAHEVSHVRNGDTTIMGLSNLLNRVVHALSLLAMWSLLLTLPLTISLGPAPLLVSGTLIVLPTMLSLMQLSLSRSREYDADLDGATLTGDPEGLAQGLLVLEQAQGRQWEVAALPRRTAPDPVALRSHPSTADRVRRLRALTPSRSGDPGPAGLASRWD